MADPIKDLLDREAIRNAIHRLAGAVDRRDAKRMESCYHPDAMEDHGAFCGDVATFIGLCTGPGSGIYQRMHHNIGTINIELDGDVANAEAYVCASGPLIEPAADGSTQSRSIYASYIDRFERRNGEWRIARRIVVKDWTDVRPIHDPAEAYPLSQFWPDDTLYTQFSPRLDTAPA